MDMDMDDRKKRIMEHVARSSDDYAKRSVFVTSAARKRQIIDHVNRTKG